jgi:hypothetical protein
MDKGFGRFFIKKEARPFFFLKKETGTPFAIPHYRLAISAGLARNNGDPERIREI